MSPVHQILFITGVACCAFVVPEFAASFLRKRVPMWVNVLCGALAGGVAALIVC